jgi:hypothetical protein
MDFDYLSAFHQIQQLIPEQGSTGSKMLTPIRHCEGQYTHSDWASFRSFDYDREVPEIRQWFVDRLDSSPPSSPLRAVWFGLFNPIDETYGVVADLDVIGSVTPIGNDPMAWASTPDWSTADNRARSAVLAAIYNAAYESDEGLGNVAEYPLALGFLAFVIPHVLGDGRPMPRLAEDAVVVGGFNSGDGVLVGRMTSRGFEPAKYAA